MLYLSLQLVASQLNQHLKNAYDLHEDVVVVSNLVEMDGSVAPNINNKLVIFLVNIEKDAVSFRQKSAQDVLSRAVQGSTPLSFNLYVMITANFTGSNYTEALKFLSSAISFFQRNPVFTHQSVPDMDRRIEKLIMDIENLSTQDLSNLWSALGGKYLPSIFYRIRMVTFDADDITGLVPVVTEPQSTVKKD